ncbi:MAG: DUF2541 family protein [Syntrophobacteraceae bacterium]|nr:DUF2541 family protein [Syntrophobacteraceae bacterium]
MKKRLSKASITLFSLSILVSPALAKDWVQLGEKKVSMENEKDEILVGKEAGRFKRIKLMVEESDVHFNDVAVVFGNGEIFDVQMRDNIPAGSHTRAIDLPGEARFIDKIVLKYKTRKGTGHKATVKVLGLTE